MKVTFDKNASLKEQLAVAEKIKFDVIRAQSFVGEDFVTDCRDQVQDHAQGTYIDDTGNLRASVRYIVRENGEIITFDKTGITVEASNAVMAALNDIPKTNGIQIIGLAGMNYASHVESKGYNVISLQADFALVDLTDKYKAIERKYNR